MRIPICSKYFKQVNNSYTTLIFFRAAAPNSTDKKVFTLVFAGLVCVINGLKREDFF